MMPLLFLPVKASFIPADWPEFLLLLVRMSSGFFTVLCILDNIGNLTSERYEKISFQVSSYYVHFMCCMLTLEPLLLCTMVFCTLGGPNTLHCTSAMCFLELLINTSQNGHDLHNPPLIIHSHSPCLHHINTFMTSCCYSAPGFQEGCHTQPHTATSFKKSCKLAHHV